MKKDAIRYVPNSYALIVKDERFNLEVYAMEAAGKWFGICFRGKAIKPAWHYSFRSEESLTKQIKETVQAEIDGAQRREEYKAKRNAPHDIKVGDVFRCSWGYDQTNIDFYQVTRVLERSVEIRAIDSMSEETAWLQGTCVPALNQFIGKPKLKRVSMVCDKPSISINSFSTAFRMEPIAKIDNKPVFKSSHWTAYA